MTGSWLFNSRAFAGKVKNATQFSTYQIKDCGAIRKCPSCHHHIDNSDVSLEWPGLPAGVKFDPSDVELLEHLKGKVGLGNSKPHLFIDEFIPTLEKDGGICSTHPEKLPGAKKDGSSVHFFHRTANAYATGHRKRRKIHSQCSLAEENVRWHKTGPTKPVIESGVQKGWKKFMVLHKRTKKGSKSEKLNWKMHQFHLGTNEDEEEGEFVVSKIFYEQQPKQKNKSAINPVIEEPNMVTVQASPRTPNTNTPNLHRPGKRVLGDEENEENEDEFISEATQLSLSTVHPNEDRVDPAGWAGKSQAVEDPDPESVHASLLCNEILDSFTPIDNSGSRHIPCLSDFNYSRTDVLEGDVNVTSGIADLNNIELDTPPDFQLADLQFGSQDSTWSWLDRL